MPNGPTHGLATMTLFVLGSGMAACAVISLSRPEAVAIPAGIFTALFVNPDLDYEWTQGHKNVQKFGGVSGGCLSALWFLFWLPYAKVMKHRGPSHWPIIGTLGRVAYMLALPSILVLTLAFYDPQAAQAMALTLAPPAFMPWFWLWFAGLALADILHILMDMIF